MQFSVALNNPEWLRWPRWQDLTSEIERLGFTGIYCSDHFPGVLEAIVTMTHLATHTDQVKIGTLVSPLSVRDPIMLARQAMAIDELSGGRMVLGVGAGWDESEHTTFGYTLGDVHTRMSRLEEGIEVITQLLRSAAPVTFEGRFFQLKQAQFQPPLERPTPIPVLIGGNGPKRTLPLVARYANVWNCQMASPDVFKTHSATLDELIQQAGRQPGDVKRTLFIPVACWRNEAECERFASDTRQIFPDMFGTLPTDQVLDSLRTNFASVIGTPESLVEQFRKYEAFGVEEVMIAYFTPNSVESLEHIAKEVMPAFATD